MITVIGIGYNANEISRAQMKQIELSERVYLLTALSKSGKALKNKLDKKGISCVTFDEFYERAKDFNELYDLICAEFNLVKDLSVAYCVTGDGASDASSAELIKRGYAVKLLSGASVISMPSTACFNVSASELASGDYYIDVKSALNVYEIDDVMLAGKVKQYLLDYYEFNHQVYFCGEKIELYEIDMQNKKRYGLNCCLFVPACETLMRERFGFGDLVRIIARLTATDGCPWDKEQTHLSIRENMIEEAYEAVDAINSGDVDAIKEELGDVLLQSLFHTDMAIRAGEFSLGDVLSALCFKLVTRHTHIFGQNKAENSESALEFWNEAKAKEKSYASLGDVLSRIPKGFPSLLRAQKVIKKLQKEGYVYNGDNALLKEVVRLNDNGLDAEVELAQLVQSYVDKFISCEKEGEEFKW